MKAVFAAALLLTLPTTAMAATKIRNGNFESGNVGYTSSLKYVAPVTNALTNAGTYTIGSNPQNFNSNFRPITDLPYGFPNGMGNYMIANGSRTSNAIVWQETNLQFTPGTEYVFEDFFATLSNVNRPVFEAYYNLSDGQGDQFLGQWHAENPIGIWQGMEARFVPTGTKLTLTIYNLTGAGKGNDFVLDAIEMITGPEWSAGQPGGYTPAALHSAEVEAVPEPATWAMMLVGFGAVGGAVRKRQSAAA